MLYNKTTKKKITTKVVFRKNMLSRGTGLMLRCKSVVEDTAWIFVFEKEILEPLTMVYVFFPIDVIFLDSKKRVIEIKENFEPFSFYAPKHKFQYAIELKKGTIKDKKIRIKNVLSF